MSETLGRGERLRAEAEQLRQRLQGASGRRYWRSLDELQQTPEFLEFLHREFPEGASSWGEENGRRDFLRLMGASLALAGLSSACTRQPEEKIVPYVKTPEQVVPGRPLFYATAVLDRGYAKGVLVESHMGRPTKIEGNPEHPASLGGSDVFTQAEILNLYDPDRSQTIINQGEIRAWSSFLAAMRSALEAQRGIAGAGLRILTGCVTSPTLAWQLEEILREMPQAKWHQWEPLGRDNARAGALLAFGEPVEANTSREGYRIAQDVSAYSLTALAKRTAPLMEGRAGAIVTLTYLGGERVVPHYNVMGVAKAALEMSVRYLAADLGPKGIRVNAISAGPVKTLAASGVHGISKMLEYHRGHAPLRKNTEQEEVGDAALFLVSHLSRGITGEVIHVDGGFHVLGMSAL